MRYGLFACLRNAERACCLNSFETFHDAQAERVLQEIILLTLSCENLGRAHTIEERIAEAEAQIIVTLISVER